VIKDERFDKLCTSLREFPEMLEKRPLVCFTDTDGKFVVLGGNMRLKAAKEIGLKELPIVLADDWTAEQKDQFLIKDNIGFGEWNFDELKADWDVEQLEAWGLEHDWETEQQLEAVEDDFDATPPENPITVLGDLYEIGEHRLLCGDSTDSEQVARLMDGEKADMVFTDPPYGMNAVSKSGVLKEKYGDDILGDSDTNAAKDSFNLIISLYPQALHIWWGANYYSSCLPDSECWIVWDKNNGESDQTDCELAWCNARSVVRQFTKASEKTNRVHPTQKPVELVSFCVERFAEKSKLICDYFLGSGTTMVASHQLKRKCYGMELDCRYADVIVKRMLKLDPTLTVKRNGVDCKNEFTNS
jgi:DNA modification methylase